MTYSAQLAKYDELLAQIAQVRKTEEKREHLLAQHRLAQDNAIAQRASAAAQEIVQLTYDTEQAAKYAVDTTAELGIPLGHEAPAPESVDAAELRASLEKTYREFTEVSASIVASRKRARDRRHRSRYLAGCILPLLFVAYSAYGRDPYTSSIENLSVSLFYCLLLAGVMMFRWYTTKSWPKTFVHGLIFFPAVLLFAVLNSRYFAVISIAGACFYLYHRSKKTNTGSRGHV